MRALFVLLIWTNAAWADCAPNERTFMACSFPNGKAVEVCMTDNITRYSYGRPGQTPELALSLRFGQGADAVPWNGVGRTIWEAVRLSNNDVVYEVYGGFDRLNAVDDTIPIEEIMFGGIFIEDQNGNELAHLRCIPATVDYAF